MFFYAKKSTLLLLFYAASAVIFYAFLGRFVLEGEIDFQFYADSLTYEKAYIESQFESVFDMISIGDNYLGPLLVLSALGGERLLVLFFNIFVLFISLKLVVKEADYRATLFVFLLFLSPLTFTSLISVNKEILSILCMSLIVVWLSHRGGLYIFFALAVSVLVRWQFTVFVLMVFCSVSSINPLRKRRLLYLLLLLVSISLAYSFLLVYFRNINAIAEQGALSSEGSGVYSALLELQNRGLYFLVFIPKALHAMYGLIFKAGNIFEPSNVYNDIFITLHCIASFSVFCIVCLRRRLSVHDDLVFVAVIYCVIFALSPIYAPRYFYPVFFLLCLVLSRKQCVLGGRSSILSGGR